MKKRNKTYLYKLIITLLVLAMLGCGCGAAQAEPVGATVAAREETGTADTETVEVQGESEGAEENAAETTNTEATPETTPEVTPEPTPEPYVEDTNRYGNTAGNLFNGGSLVKASEDSLYLYDSYKDYTKRTNPADGTSMSLMGTAIYQLNLCENVLYGVGFNEEYPNGALIAFDLEKYAMKVLRESTVSWLQAVNDALYYTVEGENALFKMNPETGEETVLVEEQVLFPVVYKDMIIFQLVSDEESLYRIPVDGGEKTKLNSNHSLSPVVYKDWIYYRDRMAAYSIRRMKTDGSEDELWLEASAGVMNIHGDTMYFVDYRNRDVICTVDLTAEKPVVEELDLQDKIEEALTKAYGEGAVKEFAVESYGQLNFADEFLLMYCNELIDGEHYTDAYLYHLTKDEVMVIPAFTTDLDDVLAQAEQQRKEEEQKKSEPTPAPAPSRSYPPGNYGVGSVYGPKLTQGELDQVADAVQAYLNSYDFASMDDYTKVSTAHDYLCNVVSYAPDWSKNRANTAWGALIYGEAQCSGYARAMKALCDAMGVGCYYVHADANASNPSHQWNVVCVDGNWYIIDVQCNDSSGFRAFFLVSDDTYANTVGMSWDRGAVPACPSDY